MSNLIAKLRHQLEVAQTLAKAHINFVVIPAEDIKDELRLVQLQTTRLEKLADVSERQTKG
jgi:hypothetical protein